MKIRWIVVIYELLMSIFLVLSIRWVVTLNLANRCISLTMEEQIAQMVPIIIGLLMVFPAFWIFED